MEEIILVGYGGHAESVADCIEREGRYKIAGYTDAQRREAVYPYLGTDEALAIYRQKGIANAFVTIGYMGKGDVRERLYRQLKSLCYTLPAIIDPSAVISASSQVGEGTFIGKATIVNAGAEVGRMCIINTRSLVEHGCRIGDFSHVAVGAVLCGGVHIGEGAFIGANSTIIQGMDVPARSFVPAGCVIRKNTKALLWQADRRNV